MYETWKDLLEDIWRMPDAQKGKKVLNLELKKYRVWPRPKDVFKAFKLCPFPPKVVIIGQDPYPQDGVADGLAFSTQQKEIPYSLKVILNEIKRTYENYEYDGNDLTWWAKQGTLLLNTALTVRQDDPASHAAIWKPFTLRTVKFLVTLDKPIVWMLWGNHAKAYEKLITKSNHLVLTSDHPASEKRGGHFIGNNHFIKCNDYLEKTGQGEIFWCENQLPF